VGVPARKSHPEEPEGPDRGGCDEGSGGGGIVETTPEGGD